MTLDQHDLCPDDWEHLGVPNRWLIDSWDEDDPETMYRTWAEQLDEYDEDDLYRDDDYDDWTIDDDMLLAEL